MIAIVATGALASCGRLRFDDRLDGSIVDNDGVADAPADAAIDRSLLLHLPLDTLLGSNTFDTVSGRIAFCNAGECPTPITGAIGQALEFSGGQRALRVTWDNALATPSAWTVTAWVRPVSSAGGAVFSRPFYDAVGDWNTWQLELLTGNVPTLTTSIDVPVAAHDQIMGPAITTAAWSHMAGTWDGSVRRLYVDGLERGSGAWTACATDTNPLVIGADINNGLDDLWFAGGVDDVRLYNRALDTAEIAALATTP